MAGEGLAEGQIRELKMRFGSLQAAAMEAQKRPEYVEEFREARWAQGDAARPWSKASTSEVNAHFWKLVYAALADDEPSDEVEAKLDERSWRWAIPHDAFRTILELRVKQGKAISLRDLSRATGLPGTPEFVGRTRTAALAKWIDENPEQAKRALDRHEIPAGFRASGRGILLPRS